ncbi:MAG TPA: hypothetical protein VGM98_23395 [Schlesneria sp.]|jgi:hypothetical protein
MADRISVECPGCLAKVTLPDSSKLGKKVKCPKCSDIFVAEAADDEESDEADDEAPAQSKGRKRPSAAPTPAKSGKKRKSSGNSGGGGSSGPLIAGGAVAVVALLGVGLWLSGVFSSQPTPPPPIAEPQPVAAAPMVAHAPPAPPAPPAISPTERILALRWLPQDTEMILHAKVADLWQAPLLKSLIDSPSAAPGIKDFQAATGLLPTDVESVTVGLTDSQQMQNVMASSIMGLPPKPPKAVAIIRTKKPVSMEEIMKSSPDLKSAEYKSKKYIESPEEYCGWLAESSTLILAKSDDLKTIMDRGESVTPRKELMFADATPHVVVVLAPKDPKMLAGGPTAPGISPEIGAMQKTMGESLTSFSLGVNIRGGFDVQTSFLLKDAQGATTVKTGAEAGLVEVRKAFDAFKMSGQPLLVEMGEQLLANLKIETKDQVVKVTTNLPDSDQQKIEQLPPLLMMMAMTGGLGGGSQLAGPPNSMSGPVSAKQPSFNLPATPDQKPPGQTDPVDAELAEGLPEGLTLSATASWSHFPTLSAGQKPSHSMQLIFDLKGDNLREVCGYGQITLKTMTSGGGGTLKVSKTQSRVHANVVKMIVPFALDEAVDWDHPDGTLRMIVLVDQSGAAANSVTAVEGTFKLLTAEDVEEFMIEEAPKTAKRPLTDPSLKAAGMKLVKSNDQSGEVLTLSCGKGFFLGRFTARNQAPGVELISRAELEKSQTVQKLDLGMNAKFAPDLSLEGKVFKGVKENTVTFKFAEVALPDANSRPVPPPPDNFTQQPNGAGFSGQPMPGQPQPQPQPGQPMPGQP